ncbi:MAG: hypothetical protein P4L86_32770 [Mycobacterium sp.]|nr:hypothetical protein [Mycobacterium sp.]
MLWPWIVLGVAVLALISSALSSGGDNKSNETAATAPQSATSSYHIIAKTTDERSDDKATYYVVIDPVDLSNDGFKQSVKLVVLAVAKTNGGPGFSADIYDDAATAQAEYSYVSNPSDVTPTQSLWAHHAQMEQHLVADYIGGIDGARASTADSAYTIAWYDYAFISTPNVGQYVGEEQWKP